jgi:hypothetical protein
MLIGWNVNRGQIWSNRLRISKLTNPRGRRGSIGSSVRLVLQCMVTAPGFGNGDVAISIVAEAVGAVIVVWAKNRRARLNYRSQSAVDSNVLSRFLGFRLIGRVPVHKR